MISICAEPSLQVTLVYVLTPGAMTGEGRDVLHHRQESVQISQQIHISLLNKHHFSKVDILLMTS